VCAGEAGGLPLGVSIFPRDIWDYFTSRRAGRAQAEQDLGVGKLVVEEYGMPKPQEYEILLRQRYQVQLSRIAGDTDVTAKVMGHAKGYNEVSKAEISRRFGQHALDEVEDQAWKDYWHGNVPK
jgi:hypothetical protein